MLTQNKFFKKNYLNIALFIIVLALTFFREPLYFFEPRIWAEEGYVFIASTFTNGILKSLFLPQLGYYSLFNNFVIALGIGLFGINGVAYVTTFFSFIALLTTITAPILLESKYWDTEFKRTIIILFTLIISSGEIWLNTINVQFYFCVFGAFLLFSETKYLVGWKKNYVLMILIIGALTGVTTIILLPFFIIKFFKEQEYLLVDKLILTILILGSVIQIYVLFFFGTSRLDFSYLDNFPSGFFRNFSAFMAFPGIVIKIVLLVSIIFFILFKKMRDWQHLLPLFVALYIALVFAFLSIRMVGGERYGYAPAVLLFIFFINLIYSKDLNKIIKIISGILVIISIYGGCESFIKTDHYYNPNWVRFHEKNIKQISDDEYFLPVFPQWPNSNWGLILTKKDLKKFK